MSVIPCILGGMAFLFLHLILHRGVRFLSLVVVVLVLLGGRRVAELTWLLGVNQGVVSAIIVVAAGAHLVVGVLRWMMVHMVGGVR